MKAAVLHKFGDTPKYEDFPDQTVGDDEILIHVKAVALENVDKAVVKGTHFASQQFFPQLPAVVSFDGIGMLEDGRLVGFGGVKPPYGSMAEKVVIPKMYHVPVPEGVDAATAAAVPASTLTSLFPLKWGAKLQPNETVLINGATGFSGKLTVQVAKLLGAKRVVATGRHEESLRALPALGADAVIDLKQSDEQIIAALVPHELSFAKHIIRLVQIGEMAGSTITLPADVLRTSGLEIKGGAGGIPPEAIGEGTQQVWEWIKAGKLRFDIEQVALKDVESAWKRTDIHGKRLVIVP